MQCSFAYRLMPLGFACACVGAVMPNTISYLYHTYDCEFKHQHTFPIKAIHLYLPAFCWLCAAMATLDFFNFVDDHRLHFDKENLRDPWPSLCWNRKKNEILYGGKEWSYDKCVNVAAKQTKIDHLFLFFRQHDNTRRTLRVSDLTRLKQAGWYGVEYYYPSGLLQ